MRKISLFILLSVLSFNASAALEYCHSVNIAAVFAQGDRDDNMAFQNSVTVEFESACGGKSWGHIALSNPAASHILSVALSAKALNKPVRVAVNTSNQTSLSNQLAFLGLF